MKIIKFKTDNIRCLTKCPTGYNPKVGSIGCHQCEYFIEKVSENEIKCGQGYSIEISEEIFEFD